MYDDGCTCVLTNVAKSRKPTETPRLARTLARLIMEQVPKMRFIALASDDPLNIALLEAFPIGDS